MSQLVYFIFSSETEKVTLYQKYLKFECPAASCRIKVGSWTELFYFSSSF